MKKVFILLTSVMFSFCTSVLASDVSGDWTVEFTDIMGPQKWDVNFKADGENLDVTVKNAQAGEMKGTGTLKGDEIAFTITQKGGGGDMFIEFSGTVTGNKMAGSREVFADPSGEGYIGGARPGAEGTSESSAGGRGGAPGGGQGSPPSGAQGSPPSGGQGAAPEGGPQGGGAPPGGQGGMPSSGGEPGGGQSQGSGSDSDNLSANTWSAVKK